MPEQCGNSFLSYNAKIWSIRIDNLQAFWRLLAMEYGCFATVDLLQYSSLEVGKKSYNSKSLKAASNIKYVKISSTSHFCMPERITLDERLCGHSALLRKTNLII